MAGIEPQPSTARVLSSRVEAQLWGWVSHIAFCYRRWIGHPQFRKHIRQIPLEGLTLQARGGKRWWVLRKGWELVCVKGRMYLRCQYVWEATIRKDIEKKEGCISTFLFGLSLFVKHLQYKIHSARDAHLSVLLLTVCGGQVCRKCPHSFHASETRPLICSRNLCTRPSTPEDTEGVGEMVC